MYTVTSMPFVSRTRATLRSAEFGFFGVVVYTRVQTPRRWGAATRRLRPLPDFRPGVASFFFGAFRPLRTSWEVVGIRRGMVAAEDVVVRFAWHTHWTELPRSSRAPAAGSARPRRARWRRRARPSRWP